MLHWWSVTLKLQLFRIAEYACFISSSKYAIKGIYNGKNSYPKQILAVLLGGHDCVGDSFFI